MRVAITSAGPTPDSRLDPRFGRCPYFVLADMGDTATHFAGVRNASASRAGGAGTRSAQLLIDKGIQVVLTGDCGPKATRALAAAGIDVIGGCAGTVDEVVDQFRSGKLPRVLSFE